MFRLSSSPVRQVSWVVAALIAASVWTAGCHHDHDDDYDHGRAAGYYDRGDYHHDYHDSYRDHDYDHHY